MLPTDRLVTRRAFPQLLAVIEAVALLRQFLKPASKDGQIDASVNDYAIAYRLMIPILSRTFAPITERAMSLFTVIVKNLSDTDTEPTEPPIKIFTRADCAKWAGVGLTEVRNRLALLVDAGLVEQLGGSPGVRFTYRVISLKATKAPALSDLITPKDLKEALKRKATPPAPTRNGANHP
jgi:hypothetical protein